MRKDRAARKAAGLCQHCGGPRDRPDRKSCKACREIAKESSRATWKRRVDAGQCGHCGVKKPAKGRTCCSACLSKMTDYTIGWRKRRRAAGQCIACGRKAAPKRTLCARCGRVARERAARIRAAKRAAA